MQKVAANSKARRNARRALLQGLVQVLVNDVSLSETRDWMKREDLLKGVDIDFFLTCFNGVCDSLDELDSVYSPYLDWPPEELGYVECTALRLGTYELLEREDVPYRVVINEWVDLTKEFGAESSFRFVNGVLHQVALTARVTNE